MASHKATSTTVGALNVYKKVAVIRRSNDVLTYEDAEGYQKSVSIAELGRDAITTATPLVTKKPKLDIPVPRINTVETYQQDLTPSYRIPNSYVRYHRQSIEEWKNSVEYIVDAEDENWLKTNSKFGGAVFTSENQQQVPETKMRAADEVSGRDTRAGSKSERKRSATESAPVLPLEVFEHMIDLLEKATGYNAIITNYESETLFAAKLPILSQIFSNAKPARAGNHGNHVTPKAVVNDVYSYWLQKRSKLKRPLLRRYWPVTSSDDSNPHCVFRPREKEKYKLRKKRQNDLDAFRKMQQLRNDFDNLRAVLDLVRRREMLHRMQVQIQVDLFQQRLYNAVDTSGCLRRSRIRKSRLQETLDVPTYFDVQMGGRKAKRSRKAGADDKDGGGLSSSSSNNLSDKDGGGSTNGAEGAMIRRNIAGKNHGEPAPHFLHPLVTRETYTSSWDGAVPHVTTYSNAHAIPTFRFRHRPRVGRGGRVCIDRLPRPPPDDAVEPVTIYTAGRARTESLVQDSSKQTLLDLLPTPLDHERLRRRIQEMSVHAVREDVMASSSPPTSATATNPIGGLLDENDGEEVIVSLDDWLETDEQLWGEERFAIGPI